MGGASQDESVFKTFSDISPIGSELDKVVILDPSVDECRNGQCLFSCPGPSLDGGRIGQLYGVNGAKNVSMKEFS